MGKRNERTRIRRMIRNGRSGRIRTCDPCIPNATLYQAELRSEILILNAHLKKNKSEEEVIS